MTTISPDRLAALSLLGLLCLSAVIALGFGCSIAVIGGHGDLPPSPSLHTLISLRHPYTDPPAPTRAHTRPLSHPRPATHTHSTTGDVAHASARLVQSSGGLQHICVCIFGPRHFPGSRSVNGKAAAGDFGGVKGETSTLTLNPTLHTDPMPTRTVWSRSTPSPGPHP